MLQKSPRTVHRHTRSLSIMLYLALPMVCLLFSKLSHSTAFDFNDLSWEPVGLNSSSPQ